MTLSPATDLTLFPAAGFAGAAPTGQPPSVLVLTKNEESNIVACLRTLNFSDDIVVLDSVSSDRTVELARQIPNVRVYLRPFDTEYKQRNFGLHEIRYQHPWLFICDADERVPESLGQEMIHAINSPSPAMAYRMRYQNMFMGRWIKHASTYPVWLIRLIRPDHVTYEQRQTNTHPLVDGPVEALQNHFIHYSFNLGLKHWFNKHNYYSTQEALEGVKVLRQGISALGGEGEIGSIKRRRILKNLSYFLGFRGLWRFLHAYVVRLGFLDGSAGLHYSLLISMYEYWMELKMFEQERNWRRQNDLLVQRLLAEGPP